MKELEQGVDEFARIMEIPKDEAELWYNDIRKYQNLLIQKGSLETTIVNNIMRITDITKLRYLANHFLDNAQYLIRLRIKCLLEENKK